VTDRLASDRSDAMSITAATPCEPRAADRATGARHPLGDRLLPRQAARRDTRDMTDDTTRITSCMCGRVVTLSGGVEFRRVREITEVGAVLVVYLDGRFHHICSVE